MEHDDNLTALYRATVSARVEHYRSLGHDYAHAVEAAQGDARRAVERAGAEEGAK